VMGAKLNAEFGELFQPQRNVSVVGVMRVGHYHSSV
jgi:hypothetical protein